MRYKSEEGLVYVMEGVERDAVSHYMGRPKSKSQIQCHPDLRALLGRF